MKLIPDPHNIHTCIFDLDGTLLNDHHELSSLTVEAIKAVRARGINVVIATGRHIEDVRYYIQQLGGGIFAITSNGANVHDADGELIYRQTLPAFINESIIPMGQGSNVHTNIYTDAEWLVSVHCETLLASHPKSNFRYRLITHEEMLIAPVLKILFYGEHDELQLLKNKIHLHHDADVHVTFSDINYLEVMRKNISKGDALGFLLDKLKLSIHHTLAFGDGMNDVELFRTVTHPVIMENANPSLHALFPTALRAKANHENGVAAFLREHVLSTI